MRVADKSKFQENDDYFHLPPLPAYLELTDITNCYQIAMAHAEYAYKKLQDLGVPREIARGVLPLHINSCLVMGISLREFTRLMGQRTCWIAQGDYWRPLIEDFRKELLTYLGAEICDYVFNPPCLRVEQTCIMPEEAEARRARQSPYQPCPLYDKIFVQTGKSGIHNSR